VIPDSFRTESSNPDYPSLFDATLLLTIKPDADRNNGRQFTCVVEDALGHAKRSQVALQVSGMFFCIFYYCCRNSLNSSRAVALAGVQSGVEYCLLCLLASCKMEFFDQIYR